MSEDRPHYRVSPRSANPSTAPLRFETVPFTELGVDRLYAALRLRSAVFVLEQTCPYLDPDNHDQGALHLLGWADAELVCYARLLAPGSKYGDAASIGRVVSDPTRRGQGLGRRLMDQALLEMARCFPGADIRISAQAYLEAFYQSLGFVTVSAPYLEDDIPHVEMLLTGAARAASR